MTNPPVSIEAPDWRKMRVQELRDELASRGLDTTGLKSALIERLEAAAPMDEGNGNITKEDEGKDMDVDMKEDVSLDGSEEKPVVEQAIEAEPPVKVVEEGVLVPGSVTDPDPPVEKVPEASAVPLEPSPREANGATRAPTTDLERKKRRAERFGLELMVSEVEKRRLRAARFLDTAGAKANGTAKVLTDEPSKMNPTTKEAEAMKRKARALRFGIEDSQDKTVPLPGNDDAKKKARLARFGLEVKQDPQEQEKKKLRAARFGLASEVKSEVASETKALVEQPIVT